MGLDTPVAADTVAMAAEGTAAEDTAVGVVAMVEAEDDIEPHNS